MTKREILVYWCLQKMFSQGWLPAALHYLSGDPPPRPCTLALVTVGAYLALAIQLTHNGDVDPKLAKR